MLPLSLLHTCSTAEQDGLSRWDDKGGKAANLTVGTGISFACNHYEIGGFEPVCYALSNPNKYDWVDAKIWFEPMDSFDFEAGFAVSAQEHVFFVPIEGEIVVPKGYLVNARTHEIFTYKVYTDRVACSRITDNAEDTCEVYSDDVLYSIVPAYAGLSVATAHLASKQMPLELDRVKGESYLLLWFLLPKSGLLKGSIQLT